MTDGKQEIAKNIFVCGPVPQYFPFSADKNLYADTNAGTEKDPFRDEQFLVIDDGALVVLTGCSHCGIMNVVEHTIKMFPEKKIRSLVGGFHLFRATDTQVEEALNYLKSKNISNICTGHCTGLDALYKLKDALGERVLMTKVGLQAFV
jgi:7,8-dihydropterin-6-yl-methyl-4-(beta-D-ribofuranosyl)aminobenzene 5'-phosphate synthase